MSALAVSRVHDITIYRGAIFVAVGVAILTGTVLALPVVNTLKIEEYGPKPAWL